ncbi:MAG: S1/P1 nuclease, partial [Bryobacteraceae bacterium]|nr:S1/P1 nuclease [Bryobacteraceae bacterium]
PDIIKGDPRFFDTVVPGSMPLPGFPDMQRHQSWHYINVPYPQEFQSQAIDPENALAQIKTLLKTLRRDGPVTLQEAYALPWILHLVTDVHQPLHTIAKFRTVGGRAEQDKGGNACYLAEDRNLHAFWDGVLGTNFDDAPVARLAASIEDHLPRPKRLDLRPETWIREGLELAEPVVYRFDGACDDRDRPLRLSAEYKVVARRIAFGRAAMAAYRLAELLNEKLGE